MTTGTIKSRVGNPRCGVTPYSVPGGELASARRRRPIHRTGRRGEREVQILGVWGLWDGKAKSLSSACSDFRRDTRNEVVGGGISERVEMAGKAVPTGRGHTVQGHWRVAKHPGCWLAGIRLLLHFFHY